MWWGRCWPGCCCRCVTVVLCCRGCGVWWGRCWPGCCCRCVTVVLCCRRRGGVGCGGGGVGRGAAVDV